MPGKLKDKDIRELVKAAKDGIGDLIAEEAIKQINNSPIKFAINIQMDEESNLLSVKSETDTPVAFARCYKICVNYGSSTRCYTICR